MEKVLVAISVFSNRLTNLRKIKADDWDGIEKKMLTKIVKTVKADVISCKR